MAASLIVFLLSLVTLWPYYIFFGHSNLVIDLGYQLNQGQTVVGEHITFFFKKTFLSQGVHSKNNMR